MIDKRFIDQQRDHYRKTFNKEALCDIAANRDGQIAGLRQRLHEVEHHTKSYATCDELTCKR